MMQNSSPMLFNRILLKKRQTLKEAAFSNHDFLYQEVAEDLADRLSCIKRNFDSGIVAGHQWSLLTEKLSVLDNVDLIEQTEDEEALALMPQSINLYISFMSLHWINDIKRCLGIIKAGLQPDGLFIAAFPAENTLVELRQSLYAAETEIKGGVSPRVAPMAHIKDLGGLLQGAGFALPVVDKLQIPVTYRDPFRLLQDLRGMAQTNILQNQQRGALRRDVLHRAMEIYKENHAIEGGYKATFEIAVMTGWAPHASQQKPLKPGSAKFSLEEAIKNSEE